VPHEKVNPTTKLIIVVGSLVASALGIGILTSVADLPILVGVIGIMVAVAIALVILLPMLATRTRR
jgi:hypothetical protein